MLGLLKRYYYTCIPQFLHKPISTIYAKLREKRYKLEVMLNPKKVLYYCPCCQEKLTSFTSNNYLYYTGVINPDRYRQVRQDIICPFCSSLPRHRILAYWCNNNIHELAGRGLYFALEKSMELWLQNNNICYKSADLYRTADLRLDIMGTGQPDHAWDWIICNHVLEHVKDYHIALKELYRILKPEGVMICSFPIDERLNTVDEESDSDYKTDTERKSERIRRFGQVDHLRVFGRDSDQLLSEIGFDVEIIDGSIMPYSILPVLGPANYDVNYLFVCRKKKQS